MSETGWRRKLTYLAMVAAVLLAPASASAGSFSPLDRDFGNHGRATAALYFGPSRFWYAIGVYSALTPEGDILVAGTGADGRVQLVRFLPDGELDASFGDGGVLRPEVFTAGQFRLADLTVDSSGRIVLAVNANVGVGAFVMRLAPNGAPDPTFGGGDGIVTPQLPIPPPSSEVFPGGPASLAQFSSVAIDAAGRIVLAGFGVRSFQSYCLIVQSGLVARLAADGSVDPSFGNNGAVIYEPDVIHVIPNFALSGTGAITIWGGGESCRESPTGGLQIVRLSPLGQPDPNFGGGQVSPGLSPIELAVDRFERTVFTGSGGSVHRLLWDGRPDRSFSQDGVAYLKLGGKWSQFDGLVLARDGSVVVTGVQTHYYGTHTPFRHLVLASLTSSGKPMPAFGRTGVVKLRSRRRVNTVGRQVMIDAEGRAIVAGAVSDPRLPYRQALAVYRFNLDRE
jgi:uncharacterized delta-60 repeat protein